MARVAGITIQLDGDATRLDKAIKQVDRSLKLMDTTLKLVNRELKFDSKNPDLMRVKISQLSDEINATSKRLKILHDMQESVEAQYEAGNMEKSLYERYEAEVIRTTNELKRLKEQLNIVKDGYVKLGQEIEKTGEKISKMGGKIKGYGETLTRNVTAPLMAAGGFSVKAAADFETGMIGVRKTVEMSDAEFEDMTNTVREMAKELPGTATELASVMAMAGQLAVPKEDLAKFTEIIQRLTVSTNIVGDEGAKDLAQFMNITNASFDSVDRLASVIVDLGNHTATTEADILHMGKRLAAVGHQVGLSDAEIMGLAATLSSVGVEAQAGGTAFSKLLLNMQIAAETGEFANGVLGMTGYTIAELNQFASDGSGEFANIAEEIGMTTDELYNFINTGVDIETFADVLGMTGDEFKKAFSSEGGAAYVMNEFINALANAEDKGTSAIQILEALGIKEVRLRDSVLRATNAHDLFNRTMERANRAYAENTALMTESNMFMSSSTEILKNQKDRLVDVAITIGNQLLPHVITLAEGAADLAEKFNELDPDTQKLILKMLGLAAAIGPVAIVSGNVMKGIGGMTSGFGKLIQVLGKRKAIADAAEGVVSLGTGAATAKGTFGLLTSAMSGFLPIAAAVAAAVGGIMLVEHLAPKGIEEAAEKIGGLGEALESFGKSVDSASSYIYDLQGHVQVINDAIKPLNDTISQTGAAIVDITRKAAEESRELTEAELKEIENLQYKLNGYIEQKKALVTQNFAVIREKLIAEGELEKSRAAEHLATVRDMHEQSRVSAEQYYSDKVAQITYQRDVTREITAQEARDLLEIERQQYEESLKQVDYTAGRTVEIIRNKTANLTEDAESYAKKHREYNEQLKATEDEYARKVEEVNNDTTKSQRQRQIDVGRIYMDERAALDELAANYASTLSDMEVENAAAWLGMAMEQAAYGTKMSSETEKMMDDIIGSFKHMTPEMRKQALSNLEAYLGGVAEKSPNLKKKIDKMLGDARRSINGEYYNYYQSGKYVGEGVAAGIASMEWTVAASARRLARVGNAAYRSESAIYSPSKKFRWLGQQEGLGLVKGHEDMEKDVEKSVRSLSLAGQHGFTSAMRTGANLVGASNITPQEALKERNQTIVNYITLDGKVIAKEVTNTVDNNLGKKSLRQQLAGGLL